MHEIVIRNLDMHYAISDIRGRVNELIIRCEDMMSEEWIVIVFAFKYLCWWYVYHAISDLIKSAESGNEWQLVIWFKNGNKKISRIKKIFEKTNKQY